MLYMKHWNKLQMFQRFKFKKNVTLFQYQNITLANSFITLVWESLSIYDPKFRRKKIKKNDKIDDIKLLDGKQNHQQSKYK